MYNSPKHKAQNQISQVKKYSDIAHVRTIQANIIFVFRECFVVCALFGFKYMEGNGKEI